MNDSQKLDRILGLLEVIVERLQETEEEITELREAVADRDLPGDGFSRFSVDEEG
jgi:hypothetical protein